MNHEKYIKQAMCSFVSQTYPKVEYLYLDNNSTDKTFEIGKRILSESARPFVAYKREKSHNLPSNFNFMIKKASGDYLCFISCDDWMDMTYIEEMVKIYEQNQEFGLLYSNGFRFYEDTGKYLEAENEAFLSGKIFNHILLNGVIFPVGIMIKKEIFNNVGLYDETIPIEDFDMWLKIAAKYEIGYSPKALVYYRQHSDSLTAAHGFKNIPHYEKIYVKYRNHHLFKKAIRNCRKFYIIEQFEQNNKKKAFCLILKQFRFERFYISTLIKTLLPGKLQSLKRY